MRIMISVALLALAACGSSSGKEKIADRVEQNADNRADAMEAAGNSMENALQQNVVEQQADMVRKAGSERADAIRNSQLEADQLTAEQKNELIKGKAAGAPSGATR